MIRRPPRSTQSRSSAASDVYKRQGPYAEVLTLRPRLLHDAGVADVPGLLDGVELGQPGGAGEVVGRGVERLGVLGGDVLDVPKPVVDEAVGVAVERGLDAPAIVVPAHDDVPVSYTHLTLPTIYSV